MKRAVMFVFLATTTLLFVAGGILAKQTMRSPGTGVVAEAPSTETENRRVAGLDEPHGDAPPLANAEAAAYNLNWYSVNSGGDVRLPGTAFDLGLTVGEPVAGLAKGSRFDLGFGFWYGATACPIVLSGDVNLNSVLSTSDIIVLVNYALKAGPNPLPCIANADLNCDGAVSLSDIVVLINRVLKGGPDPCNVCDIIPSLWSCP